MIKAKIVEKKLAVLPGLQAKIWGLNISLSQRIRTRRVLALEVYPLSHEFSLNLDYVLPKPSKKEMFGGECEHTITVTVLYHERYGQPFEKFVRGVSGHNRTIRHVMRSVIMDSDQSIGRSSGHIIFDAVMVTEALESPKLGRIGTTYEIYACPRGLCP